MKATQLGSVIFEYPQEVLRASSIMSEKVKSADGVTIAFEAWDYTPEIMISSAEDDWLSQQNVTELQTMFEQMGTTHTIYYENGTTEEVRFDHTKQISFTEILYGTCIYYGNIPLEKIH